MRASSHVVIFQSGALGDHVLIWPLVRSLIRQGSKVTLVGSVEYGRACQRVVGGEIEVQSQELAKYSALWSGAEPVAKQNIETDVQLVVSFLFDPQLPHEPWMHGVSQMFPCAKVKLAGSVGSVSRNAMWMQYHVSDCGATPAAVPASTGVLMHVGAGSRQKCWALERWRELARRLIAQKTPVECLCGPVELEKFMTSEHKLFLELCKLTGSDPSPPATIDVLMDRFQRAGLCIGADTGPMHLSAQMGLPTISLFGPTAPQLWQPVGPGVRVIAPECPMGMEWLSVQRVYKETLLYHRP